MKAAACLLFLSLVSALAQVGPASGDIGEPGSSGTGFFITEDGYLVTNEHVVRNASRIRVRTRTQTLDASLVKSSKAFDLAVLKVEGRFKSLPLDLKNTLQLGDSVFTIGFPNPEILGIEPKYSDGKVSSLAGMEDDPSQYQISVPLQPGNSGGPLVDGNGAVVGVVRAKLSDLAALLTTGSVPQNVNYAVKIRYLRGLLETVPGLLSTVKQPEAKMSAREAVTSAQAATAIILVYDTPLRTAPVPVTPKNNHAVPVTPQVRPPNPAELQAAKLAAEKKKAAQDAAVLKLHEELAAKGDAYGQYRMGKRFLDGDGVPKDLVKAKEYLTKASAQGSADATAELSRLLKEEADALRH